MKRNRVVLTAWLVAVGLGAPAFSAHGKPQKQAAEAVVEWNVRITEAVATLGLPPNRESRVYAMAFTAIHDSLNAIQRRFEPYVCDTSAPGASPTAAVAAAAHEVIVATMPPAVAALIDIAYASDIAQEAPGPRRDAGVALGRRCANAMLALRAHDGADDAQVPYAPGENAGDYQFTFPFDEPGTPIYGIVGDPLWNAVQPFVLQSAAQFRSEPPYAASKAAALTSATYAADVNEVKARGVIVGSTRTEDESVIAFFWKENSPLGWNRIARTVGQAAGYDGWELARLFALLQLAEADAYLASFDTKFFYTLWRPITAIRLADTDANAATSPDPAWLPFDPVTPPVPDYNSAHSAAGGAARAVLSSAFGRDDIAFAQTSTSLPGITRTYSTFTEAADENGLSRILIGYHFRRAVTAGRTQGERVGQWVFDHALAPRK